MPRTPSTPRLDELDAGLVAAQVSQTLLSTATMIAELGGWSLKVPTTGDRLGDRVDGLVTWVQCGDPDLIVDALRLLDELVPALFARPIDGPPDHEPPIDPRTELGLLLCAGLARRKLDAKLPVPAVQLAALGGVDVSRVRQHIRQGELRRTTKAQKRGRAMDRPVRFNDARRWLEERDVDGLDEGGAA